MLPARTVANWFSEGGCDNRMSPSENRRTLVSQELTQFMTDFCCRAAVSTPVQLRSRSSSWYPIACLGSSHPNPYCLGKFFTRRVLWTVAFLPFYGTEEKCYWKFFLMFFLSSILFIVFLLNLLCCVFTVVLAIRGITPLPKICAKLLAEFFLRS